MVLENTGTITVHYKNVLSTRAILVGISGGARPDTLNKVDFSTQRSGPCIATGLAASVANSSAISGVLNATQEAIAGVTNTSSLLNETLSSLTFNASALVNATNEAVQSALNASAAAVAAAKQNALSASNSTNATQVGLSAALRAAGVKNATMDALASKLNASSVGNATGGGLDEALTATQNAVNATGNAVSDAISAASALNATQSAVAAAASAVNATQEGLGSALGAALRSAGNITNTTTGSASAVADAKANLQGIQSVLNSTTSALSSVNAAALSINATKSSLDAIAGLADSVNATTSTILQAVTSAASANGTLQGVTAALQSSQAAANGVSELLNSTSERLDSVLELATSAASGGIPATFNVSQWTTRVKGLSAYAQQLKNTLTSSIETLVTSRTERLATLVQAALAQSNSLPDLRLQVSALLLERVSANTELLTVAVAKAIQRGASTSQLRASMAGLMGSGNRVSAVDSIIDLSVGSDPSTAEMKDLMVALMASDLPKRSSGQTTLERIASLASINGATRADSMQALGLVMATATNGDPGTMQALAKASLLGRGDELTDNVLTELTGDVLQDSSSIRGMMQLAAAASPKTRSTVRGLIANIASTAANAAAQGSGSAPVESKFLESLRQVDVKSTLDTLSASLNGLGARQAGIETVKIAVKASSKTPSSSGLDANAIKSAQSAAAAARGSAAVAAAGSNSLKNPKQRAGAASAKLPSTGSLNIPDVSQVRSRVASINTRRAGPG